MDPEFYGFGSLANLLVKEKKKKKKQRERKKKFRQSLRWLVGCIKMQLPACLMSMNTLSSPVQLTLFLHRFNTMVGAICKTICTVKNAKITLVVWFKLRKEKGVNKRKWRERKWIIQIIYSVWFKQERKLVFLFYFLYHH